MSQEKAQLIAPLGVMAVEGMNASGVITATTLDGNIVGSAKSLVNGANVSVGVITATSFAGNLTGNIARLADSAPDVDAGVTTATSFVGNLTGSVTDLTSQPAITVGMVTATTLEGPVTGNVTGNVTGIADGLSDGLGVNYNGGWTGAGTSQITAGVVTATTFYGDGSNLDGVSSGPVSQQSIGITSATTSIDLSNGNLINATQSSSTTVSFANTENGNVYFVRVKDDTTTARTITWPDRIKWDGGSAPTLLTNAGGSDLEGQVFLLVTRDMGVTWYGKEVVNYDTLTSYTLWAWGYNSSGSLGLNQAPGNHKSSPVQIPGNWSKLDNGNYSTGGEAAIRNDKTLWAWGYNDLGALGQNNRTTYSSPVQIPGAYSNVSWSYRTMGAVKTDGTMWTWGKNQAGQLGQNDGANAHRSSPVQVGTDTTWGQTRHSMFNNDQFAVIKTDGTLWSWGSNTNGQLGHNQAEAQLPGASSPTQIPGTTWSAVSGGNQFFFATKTDNTLWAWGQNQKGELGIDNTTTHSSPVQIPGTTWNITEVAGSVQVISAFKTDGSLWGWGRNISGALGQNQAEAQLAGYSSPVQLSGTTWNQIATYDDGGRLATRSDGTAWTWGYNGNGGLGLNNTTSYSSPTQLPGTDWTGDITGKSTSFFALRTS